ncbi:MAG: cellulose binding domain-containing protein, partial [Ruminococcus sp.]
ACDYNAGFTGLMAKMTEKFGGKTDPAFPEPEQRDDEFYVEAQMKQQSDSGVSLSLKLVNHTAWPARVVDNLSYRYYFDASEVINAGYNASDITVRIDRDQAAMYGDEYRAEYSPVTQYKDNIYYIEVKYSNGEAILPISEGRQSCETMLSLVFPDYKSGWDAANDYSNQDILTAEDPVKTDKVTVYIDGKLVFGTEPDGTKPDPGQDAPSAVKGDVNLDGKVSMTDAIVLNKYLVNITKLNSNAAENADYNSDKKINILDLSGIKSYLIK